jgi:hypothetical protein
MIIPVFVTTVTMAFPITRNVHVVVAVVLNKIDMLAQASY